AVRVGGTPAEAPTATPVATASGAVDANVCAIYGIIVSRATSDGATTMIVYDSVSLAVPAFALHGWVGRGVRDSASASIWEGMRGAHGARESLPACVTSAGKQVVRLRYDSLAAMFDARGDGWSQVERDFPNARGVFVLGRPMFAD